MGRFQRSVELAKASWATLKADRELLVLPVLSFLGSAVAFGIAVGLVFIIDYDSTTGLEEFELSPAGGIILVLASLAVAIIATYFQAAMVGGARERLTGGDPTVGSALATATSRLGVIIPWALFSWTVGAVLRAIEERAGIVGRVVGSFLGMAFRVVTFLAVPILVVQGLGPIATLKDAAGLFRRTWGENLAGQLGIGILSFLALLPGILVGGLVAAAVSPIIGIIIGGIWVAAVIVVSTSLTAIYQTALYQYVTTGEIPSGFERAQLPTAFEPR